MSKKKLVVAILVTGEEAIGWHDGTRSPLTGSYLLTDLHTANGGKAEFSWAVKIAAPHAAKSLYV